MPESMPSIELNSLIRLLDDPDHETYTHIRERFASYGSGCIGELEQVGLRTSNTIVNRRVNEIISRLRFNEIALQLKAWRENNGSLIDGLNLLSKYEYPAIDLQDLRKTEEKIVRNTWLELNYNLTALEEVKVVNHILFEVYGFEKSPSLSNDYAEGNFIRHLLDTGKGTNTILSGFYLALCELIKIPVSGICLPGLLLAAYTLPHTGETETDRKHSDILFYIDPSDRGEIFLADTVEKYLRSANLEPRQGFYSPCSSHEVMSHIASSISEAYFEKGRQEKAADMKKLSKMLLGAESTGSQR